jgi:glycosyltransferase involved in cell wall biosynthesis
MPAVSILMPAYNAAEYIGEAIDSIRNQEFKDWELIIVNDGSSDDTLKIINDKPDDRIIIINNERNRGIAFSRNLAIENSKAEYIAWLDADDISYQNRLITQLNFLNKNKNIDIVGSDARLIPGSGIYKNETDSKKIKTFLLFKNVIINSSVLVRKKVYTKLRYNSDFDSVEDFEMWAKASWDFTFINLPFTLIDYRMHSNSATRTKIVENAVKGIKVQISQLKRILDIFEISISEDLDVLNDYKIFYIIEEFRKKINQKKSSGTFPAEFDSETMNIVVGALLNTLIDCRGVFTIGLLASIYKSSCFKRKPFLYKSIFILKCVIHHNSPYSKYIIKLKHESTEKNN